VYNSSSAKQTRRLPTEPLVIADKSDTAGRFWLFEDSRRWPRDIIAGGIVIHDVKIAG